MSKELNEQFWISYFTSFSGFSALTLLPLIGSLTFAYLISETVRFFVRMAAYFAIIFTTAVLIFPVTMVTYFLGMGCTPVLTLFRFSCSPWIGINVEIRDREKIAQASGPDDRPLVLISNHQSSLDIYIMSTMWPSRCTALVKSTLKYLPFFNASAFLSHIIFVNKYVPEEAHKAIGESVDTMRKRQMKIWIFPEGTRYHDNGLLPFKKGAFNIAIEGKYAIVPVVISSFSSFYSKRDRFFRTGGRVIVKVLDPIYTDELARDDVPVLCEQVRSDMLSVYEKLSDEVNCKLNISTSTAPVSPPSSRSSSSSLSSYEEINSSQSTSNSPTEAKEEKHSDHPNGKDEKNCKEEKNEDNIISQGSAV